MEDFLADALNSPSSSALDLPIIGISSANQVI